MEFTPPKTHVPRFAALVGIQAAPWIPRQLLQGSHIKTPAAAPACRCQQHSHAARLLENEKSREIITSRINQKLNQTNQAKQRSKQRNHNCVKLLGPIALQEQAYLLTCRISEDIEAPTDSNSTVLRNCPVRDIRRPPETYLPPTQATRELRSATRTKKARTNLRRKLIFEPKTVNKQ